jgi:hypothetical protein
MRPPRPAARSSAAARCAPRASMPSA